MASSRKKSRSTGGITFGMVTVGLCLLLLGCVGGYALRSFRPLPLPFESPLVADKSSENVADKTIKDIVKTATERAEKAELERDALRTELATLKTSQQKTESELADLQIKSVLSTPAAN